MDACRAATIVILCLINHRIVSSSGVEHNSLVGIVCSASCSLYKAKLNRVRPCPGGDYCKVRIFLVLQAMKPILQNNLINIEILIDTVHTSRPINVASSAILRSAATVIAISPECVRSV